MLLESMEDLLLDQLRNLYSIETQLEVALPVIVADTTSPALREQLTQHFEDTEGHIVRLQEIFGALGVSARGPRCMAISALLQETHETIRRCTPGGLLDAATISCMLRVAQYEMASYSTATAYARVLGQTRMTELLSATLAEEANFVLQLGRVAEREVLEQGAQAGILAA